MALKQKAKRHAGWRRWRTELPAPGCRHVRKGDAQVPHHGPLGPRLRPEGSQQPAAQRRGPINPEQAHEADKAGEGHAFQPPDQVLSKADGLTTQW